MKIDRLLGIITVLLNKERVTAPYLAEKFEVSRRTINRDIEDICKAGIPIVTLQGNNGGISIEKGYKIDKNLLKKEELNAILTGLKSIDSVAGNRNNQNIIEKLSCKENESNSDFMRIDLASHYKDSLSYKIDRIKEAEINHVVIQFLYYSSKGESHRSVEPYYVTYKWSSWYLFGYCLDKKEFRGEFVHKSINQNVNEWGNYTCTPSRFIHQPDSIFYADNKELTDYECEYIVNNRNEIGIWNIRWEWGMYPEEFAISKNWWSASIIIENLLFLKNFNVI